MIAKLHFIRVPVTTHMSNIAGCYRTYNGAKSNYISNDLMKQLT